MTTIILMAWRYLWGRKLRTTLTTLAVVFGVAVLFAGNMMMPAAMDSFRRMTLSASDAVDLSITTRGGESFAPEGPVRIAGGVGGVRAVSPVLRRQVQLTAAPEGGFAQYDLVGVDPAVAEAARPYRLAAGRFLVRQACHVTRR